MTNKKRIYSIIGIILGIAIIIFIYIYFFTKETNWIIYSGSKETHNQYFATSIIYHGPDINSEGDEYSGSENTNGIICIFTLESKWDEFRDNYPRIYIVGNVTELYNTNSKTSDYNDYMREIEKYHFLNSFDYEY